MHNLQLEEVRCGTMSNVIVKENETLDAYTDLSVAVQKLAFSKIRKKALRETKCFVVKRNLKLPRKQ